MANEQFTPCIILPGIGQSKIEQLGKDGNREKMAWPFDIDGDALMAALKAPLMKSMLFRRDCGISEKLAAFCRDLLEPVAVNPDGSMKHRLRAVKYPSLSECSEGEKRYIYKMVPLQKLAQTIGEERLFFFAYNSFGDIWETAAELDEFIERVKADTHSERVNLVAVSLGGALSTAYLDAYGYKNNIKRILYFVSALDGTQLMADLMNRRVNADRALSLLSVFGAKKSEDSIDKLINMLPADVPENVLKRLLDVLLEALLKNSVMLWATVPQNEYGALREKYLGENEALREKTDRFHLAQKNLFGTITERMKNGTEFFSIAGYGLPLPLVESDKISSDGVINISSTSLGARAAALGETLSDSACLRRCEDETHSHISPDGCIDAACGFLPESTWYFSSQQHDAMAYNDTALEIARRVLSDDGFKNIYSDSSLPQFGQSSDNRK